MKRLSILFVLVSIVLIGCSSKEKDIELINTEVIQEVVVNSVIDSDFKNHFSELTIDGVDIKFPSSFKTMKESGFTVQSVYTDTASAQALVPTICRWKDVENAFFTIGYRFIGEKGTKPLEECDAVTFSLDSDSVGSIDAVFYGGITFNSTREEVAAVLDEIHSSDTSAEYGLFLDEKQQSGVCVYFYNDKVKIISLYNYANYVD